MEPQIKIGDEVKLINPSERTIKITLQLSVVDEGTIVDITSGCDIRTDWIAPLLYGIEWSTLIMNGHDCNGKCKDGHGSYVEPDEIMVI